MYQLVHIVITCRCQVVYSAYVFYIILNSKRNVKSFGIFRIKVEEIVKYFKMFSMNILQPKSISTFYILCTPWVSLDIHILYTIWAFTLFEYQSDRAEYGKIICMFVNLIWISFLSDAINRHWQLVIVTNIACKLIVQNKFKKSQNFPNIVSYRSCNNYIKLKAVKYIHILLHKWKSWFHLISNTKYNWF